VRPVERGPSPQAGDFEDYSEARPALCDRIGSYCSFCERYLSNPHVEHIRCRDSNPRLSGRWSNFLLSCTNCNSTKGTKISTDADVSSHLWPHQDFVFTAYKYISEGRVAVNDSHDLTKETAEKAQKTADLVGLFKRPGAGLTPEQQRKRTDLRWSDRRDAWTTAVDWQRSFEQFRSPESIELLLKTVRKTGFFSVWYTVFCDDLEIRNALSSAFPGTAVSRMGYEPRSDSTESPTID
jgi:uncharacterized protein (TIGR02646 family)